MPTHIRVTPRFGDSVRVVKGGLPGPRLVAEVGPDTVLSIAVDDEPGSAELAAQFARELAGAALRYAQECDDYTRTQTFSE
ncbi:hypothetical protein SAMN04489732_101454 [Amycolatopsis saalfeldensis]|uniref:Uncharacterized protein n=2 Tax=Amycolatopsis saalfeldensis TaxID=394193 RepID=A0A1H8QR16_9PSEU|nr:hypothetical protein SAMN04489732_101454 [Amycolatopsis saalfeldensis]